MATAIESGIGALNYGRQTAKGTKATAATTTVGYNRPKWFDGTLAVKKTLGAEPYIDGQRFASPSMYTDRVGGMVGTPIIQAQPENVGLFYAAVLGVDTVTGGADPYTHTITSAGTSGHWGTWWQKVGSAVGPQREIYWDSKIAKLVDTCGRDQKNMHLALDVMALLAGEIFTVDPAKTEDTSDPYLWTEVTGTVTFDGTVVSEVSEESIEVDTGMEAFYGDDIKPAQLIEKKGSITRTLTSIITDATLAKYRLAIWNNATPSLGDTPVKNVFYAAVSTLYTRSATRTVTKTTPKVAVKPDDMSVGALREGGAIPITFGGDCLKSGGTPALSVVALSGDTTTYA